MTKLNWEQKNKEAKPKAKRNQSNRTKVLKAYENGAKNERQRIIKLLQQHQKDSPNLHFEYWSALSDAVSLIKGENK